MRLGSALFNGQPVLVALAGEDWLNLSVVTERFHDVSEVLAAPDGLDIVAELLSSERGTLVNESDLIWRPLAPRPGKVICLGLNYADHAAESPYDRPDYPVLFARFTTSLIGHRRPLVRPTLSDQFDYEGELVALIGRRAHGVTGDDALAYVAGYSIFNDASIRDYQFKSPQWTVGKNFDGTGAFGPIFVSVDELPPGASGLQLTTKIGSDVMQDGNTADMLFGVAETIEIVSAAITLEPGDVLVMGTPGGVGFARKPPVFLRPGDTVTVTIEGIGELVNDVVDELQP
jgi:2-keto-4-pentenoate hydratase/2-oxohepta-3-ene-1,7-dioic acid hydratase in catechol pathway